MVIASKHLLKEVRMDAIKDELLTMPLQGILFVVPLVVKPTEKPDGKG